MRPEVWNPGRMFLVLALFAAAWTTQAASSQSQQRPVFRSDVNFITVDAYPLVDGRVLEGLTSDDFEVREDGRPQKIESFDFVRANERMTESQRQDPNSQAQMLAELADPRSRVFLAYLDVHHVDLDGAFFSRPAIVEMFQRVLAPNDLIALATSRNEPREMTFGRTTTVVEEQLRRYWTWQEWDVTVNDAEELTIKGSCLPFDEELAGEVIARRRQDQLLTNLEKTVAYLGEVREGRKILFLFSKGWEWFAADSKVLKTLERFGYVPATGPGVGAPPVLAPPGTTEPRGNLGVRSALYEGGKAACEQELMRVAAFDGGARFRALLGDAAAANVAIYPVNPAGVGAIGPKNDRLMEMARHTGGTAITNRNDLVQGVIETSREFESYYLLGYASDNQKADGRLRRIEVTVRRPGVQVKARQGYRAMSAELAALKASPVAAPAIDAERAALNAAFDVLGAIRAGDEAAFDLSRYLKADAAPYLGAPSVFRANPSPRSPVVAVAAPVFRRSDRLHVEWPIEGDYRSHHARVVGRDGVPLEAPVVLAERREGSRRILTADVVLASLAAADFVLELTVQGEGESGRSRVAFRVTR